MTAATGPRDALLRAGGSVRVRVTVLSAAVFATTLVVASVALLAVLERRLVGDIRRSDARTLATEATAVMTYGLPKPGAQGTVVVGGGVGIAYQLPTASEQPIVATAVSPAADVMPGQRVDTIAPVAAAPTAVVVEPDGVGHAAVGSDQTVTWAPALFGVAGEPGPFLVSTLDVGEGLTLSTASSLATVESTLETMRAALWVVVPSLVFAVAALSWLLVSRALRPVHRLTAATETISSTSLDQRLPVPSSRDEIAHLARTVNTMLARLEQATLTSRRLVSDAAHELRTPITVIRAELDVARRDPASDWDQVSAALVHEVDRLQGLVDDLLLLTRIAERPPRRERLAALDIVRDVAARRRAVPVRFVVDADHDGTSLELEGDVAALARAVDHVVANATRHARSRVEVRLADEDGALVIDVDDDGSGIPPEDRARVLERFVRLDEGRSRDAGGCGLGLAVANEVCASHGGSISIDDSPLGGARVSLRFTALTPRPHAPARTA